jgi:hypothetical protein
MTACGDRDYEYYSRDVTISVRTLRIPLSHEVGNTMRGSGRQDQGEDVIPSQHHDKGNASDCGRSAVWGLDCEIYLNLDVRLVVDDTHRSKLISLGTLFPFK